MATRLPDQRLVYLHCRSLFDGVNAQLRQKKHIRRILQANKTSIVILTQEFSVDAICSVAKELLQDGIFESTSKARLRFPEVFETTAAQKSARVASEAEVARSEAEAIEKAIELSDKEGAIFTPTVADGKFPLASKKPNPNGVVPDRAPKKSKTATSSLYPVYIPYGLQHRMLTSIQSSLEECCFDFGTKWLPEIITSEGWEVPEQVELTTWTAKLNKHAKKIPTDAVFKIPEKSWEEVLFGTHELRHSAVHRLKTTVYGLVNLIESAVLLARMLKDIPRAQWIEGIRDNLKSSIEEMEGHKKVLQEKLSSELQSIAQKRAELDALEKMAIKEMFQSDIDNRLATGQRLAECLLFSGVRLKVESDDREAPNSKKINTPKEEHEKFEESGSIPQQSSSILNTKARDFEPEDEVLCPVQSSTHPKSAETAAKDGQNDNFTESKQFSILSPSIYLPTTRLSEENFVVTESDPWSIYLAKAQHMEGVILETGTENEGKAFESEVGNPEVTLVTSENTDKTQSGNGEQLSSQTDEFSVSKKEAESLLLALERVGEAKALPEVDEDRITTGLQVAMSSGSVGNAEAAAGGANALSCSLA